MPEIDPPEPEPENGDSPDSSNQTNQTENREITSQPVRKGTVAKLRRFIQAYTESGCVNHSCEVSGVARTTHYHKLQTDPAYQRAFEEAQEQVARCSRIWPSSGFAKAIAGWFCIKASR